MGFFSKYNDTETSLLEIYKKLPELSEVNVEELLDLCIEESKEEGTYNLPEGRGDLLLIEERKNENIKEKLEVIRKEGVTDKDIRWWYNLNDIEKRMMLKTDEMARMALFMSKLQGPGSDKEAAESVKKYHPMYGNPEDTEFASGNDRPLPVELKDRINIYVEKQGIDNSEFKKKIESSSTFNALIRKEIKKGNI